MSENDLTLVVARCMQNFADVENHNQNTCYVPPSLETLDERAKQSYLNDALFHRKVDTIVYSVREHNAALREKCAELEKDVQVAKGQYQGACDIIAELQRKLDGYEQAKAEERESALKVMRHAAAALAHAAESNPLYQDAYNEIDAAIRERKP